MILTVTMNPAYDLTYRLDKFEYAAVQRIPVVEQRVGGKGLNVARVLRALGHEVVAMGFADAAFARAAAAELPVDFVEALPFVRRTVVLSEADGTTTGLWEPGAALNDPAAVDDLKDRIAARLPQARGLVISGSLPAGLDPGFPATLARLAIRADVPVICDVDGEALRQAAKVEGVVLMPNTDELAALLGGDAGDRAAMRRDGSGIRPASARDAPVDRAASVGAVPDDPGRLLDVVQPLQKSGAAVIVATRGRDGVFAMVRGKGWSAAPPAEISGNPTGAGDAAAAALIAGLAALPKLPRHIPPELPFLATVPPGWLGARELDWPALVAEVVATSAAAVARPVAGEIDLDLRARLIPEIRVREWNTWLY
ncbi:PfkB family carbohydrate kinase [Nocardia sp. NPDC052001]|uniref:PfkB family carbohydrate kinase n=1 Tax=Nocardia sp. NPDC052001 TaxID=3154853 RepID=UPI00342FEDEE